MCVCMCVFGGGGGCWWMADRFCEGGGGCGGIREGRLRVESAWDELGVFLCCLQIAVKAETSR